MTTIPFSPQSSLRAYMKSLPHPQPASNTKLAADEAISSARPPKSAPIPEPGSVRSLRGIKDASGPKGLIDSRTALAISQGGVIPHPVIEESVSDTAAASTKSRAHIMPIKVPYDPNDTTTSKIKPEQPPVKAPPGGIWTPYDPPVAQAPLDDGGFVITLGPDGTAVCGPGPSGPVYLPTKTEEM